VDFPEHLLQLVGTISCTPYARWNYSIKAWLKAPMLQARSYNRHPWQLLHVSRQAAVCSSKFYSDNINKI